MRLADQGSHVSRYKSAKIHTFYALDTYAGRGVRNTSRGRVWMTEKGTCPPFGKLAAANSASRRGDANFGNIEKSASPSFRAEIRMPTTQRATLASTRGDDIFATCQLGECKGACQLPGDANFPERNRYSYRPSPPKDLLGRKPIL